MSANSFVGHNTMPQQFSDAEGGGEENKSSLQKTIGNVLNTLNDGLYRIKNRTKAE